MSPAAPLPGFVEPVRDAQRVFRAVMTALAEPGRVVPVDDTPVPPGSAGRTAAAVLLALADYETPLWLSPALRGDGSLAAFLRFHTGAPLVEDAGRAAFALVSANDFNGLEGFSIGSLDDPDRSATVVLDVAGLAGEGPLTLRGPGIPGLRRLGVAPLPAALVPALAANRGLYPRGVDLVLAAPGAVAGLPRSTTVTL